MSVVVVVAVAVVLALAAPFVALVFVVILAWERRKRSDNAGSANFLLDIAMLGSNGQD